LPGLELGLVFPRLNHTVALLDYTEPRQNKLKNLLVKTLIGAFSQTVVKVTYMRRIRVSEKHCGAILGRERWWNAAEYSSFVLKLE
jgi:hypothetical protein